MPHFYPLVFGLTVAPLLAAIQAQPELFNQHAQRTSAADSPHRGVSDIWVRYNDPAKFGPHFNDEHDAVWYPAWYALPELKPLVFGLMEYVQGTRLGGILITKLPPGGVVKTHVDSGWHAGYYEKFTIALQNRPGAVFRFPDADLLASSGDCYWFDNSVPHGVMNHSDQDRLALIVCIKTDLFQGMRHD